METNENQSINVLKLPAGFEVNNALFKANGVIGRQGYFYNSLKIIVIALVSEVIPLFLFLVRAVEPAMVLGFLFLIPASILGFMNSFKRLRDMRGTKNGEVVAFIGMFFVFGIPYLNLIMQFTLFLYPGAITSGAKPFMISQDSINRFKDKVASSINGTKTAQMDIKQLHELKMSGAITEEEYNSAKEKLLKKIA